MIATAVRDRQHAADHDVAGADRDLFGVSSARSLISRLIGRNRTPGCSRAARKL